MTCREAGLRDLTPRQTIPDWMLEDLATPGRLRPAPQRAGARSARCGHPYVTSMLAPGHGLYHARGDTGRGHRRRHPADSSNGTYGDAQAALGGLTAPCIGYDDVARIMGPRSTPAGSAASRLPSHSARRILRDRRTQARAVRCSCGLRQVRRPAAAAPPGPLPG